MEDYTDIVCYKKLHRELLLVQKILLPILLFSSYKFSLLIIKNHSKLSPARDSG